MSMFSIFFLQDECIPLLRGENNKLDLKIREKGPANKTGTESWPFSPPLYTQLLCVAGISGALLDLEPASNAK